MHTKDIAQTVILPCTPDEAFNAWLDSEQHGAMTGGKADIEPEVGGQFTVWDGSVNGDTIEIDREHHKIVQSWYYNYEDWNHDAPSILTLEFSPYRGQTKLHMWHKDLPANHADDIAEGWEAYYWQPMKEYFKKRKG